MILARWGSGPSPRLVECPPAETVWRFGSTTAAAAANSAAGRWPPAPAVPDTEPVRDGGADE